MAADICPRYLSHKSVSGSPVAVPALVPDVIRVEQWPLYQDRGVQRHSCSTGAGVEPRAGTGGLGRRLTTRCKSSDTEWVATLPGEAAGSFKSGVLSGFGELDG